MHTVEYERLCQHMLPPQLCATCSPTPADEHYAQLRRDARIGQLVRRRLADVTSEYGYATVSLRDLHDIDAEGGA